jgi:hypothetical protein
MLPLESLVGPTDKEGRSKVYLIRRAAGAEKPITRITRLLRGLNKSIDR